MKVGERLEVQATTLGRDGDTVAVHGAIDVHVPYMLVGERALVRIENVGREVPERRRRAHALLLELHRASAERVVPPCRDHEQQEGRCSGCPWMIATPAFQRSEKQRWLKEEFALDVSEVVSGPSDFGYRWSSKRVARSHGGRLYLGSFRRGTHQVADMGRCVVDHPDIAECARELAEVATQLGIEAYDERSHQGDLRYVWFKTNGAGDVLVTLITASVDTRARELAEALPTAAGVAWSVQPSEGNAIRGTHYESLRGLETITLELGGHRVEAGPLGFLQPNPKVAELAYRDLCAEVRGDVAFDLYAGAGITTHLLRARVAKVVPCEAYPESAEALEAPPESVEAFLERALAGRECPDVVVANPPRAGIGDAACRSLLALADRGLGELRIMSCSPLALRRDLERLAPGFELRSLKAYDTLPHTPHVELVAKLHARRRSE